MKSFRNKLPALIREPIAPPELSGEFLREVAWQNSRRVVSEASSAAGRPASSGRRPTSSRRAKSGIQQQTARSLVRNRAGGGGDTATSGDLDTEHIPKLNCPQCVPVKHVTSLLTSYCP